MKSLLGLQPAKDSRAAHVVPSGPQMPPIRSYLPWAGTELPIRPSVGIRPTLLRINSLTTKNSTADIMPERSGEMNQDKTGGRKRARKEGLRH